MAALLQLPRDGAGDKDGQICSLNSKEFEGESSEYSSDEGECEENENRVQGKIIPEAVQVLPPPSLSDQLQLLTPAAQPQAIADLYSTVKKAPRSRSEGEGEEGTHQPESDRHKSQSDSAPAQEKSLFMHDLTPPWKQMVSPSGQSPSGQSPSCLSCFKSLIFSLQRSHNSSSNGSSDSPSHSSEQPSHTATQSTPPPPPLPRPPRRSYTPPTHSHLSQGNVPHPNTEDRQLESPGLYDRLPSVLPPPSIPSKAGEEGVYDIIPGHRRHVYLHEKMAASEKSKEQVRSTPPVSWTPQLPPRNSNSTLTRTCSAEVMGSIVKEGLARHGSERRSSSSGTPEPRERSHSSSSSKRVRSSSTERDRERKARRDRPSSDHHHHRRSSERSSSEKRKSSSEKHRSSDKKSSPPSSKSKSGSEGSVVWRILSSTASSKSKSSSTKESSHKREKEEKDGRKEERKEKDKERKHSASRGKESRGSSSSSSRTHRSSSQRKEENMSMVSMPVWSINAVINTAIVVIASEWELLEFEVRSEHAQHRQFRKGKSCLIIII